ncbi:aldose epimerase family protein [Granulicella tundricola]|uniref:Aldose 1-epimerase n=1 Tax=Granulicella tundricola (strain ATCC BAA-1859 / DSM 23138 / MP5ACTX9) TaxID=1198114 RepID=E8X1K0_GRATM|nr:aldose epimerase family protein [Granulicella tundricola]ADW70235.1 Aldose 1-epimerase [Granulicella tundricola MP5ACTX9]
MPHSTASLFTLRNDTLRVTLTNYGARIISILAPDRTGHQANVVLSHASLEAYEADRTAYLGATIGRVANRIAKGRFTLDGVEYQLPINNAPNNLHAGPEGFDRRLWTATEFPDAVEFTLTSPAGDQGFPGTLTVTVRYTLTASALQIEFTATTDAPTIVNLTNHAYFNLSGNASTSIEDHILQIAATHYTPKSAANVPTGELAPVAGTPFDFRQPQPIGSRIEDPILSLYEGIGYDHNFVLTPAPVAPAATVTHPPTGRTLTVHTTEPGVHFYTGDFLAQNGTHPNRTGFCLETQHFPDSPNHPHFPSTILRPGETFRSATTFTFTTNE